MLTLRHHLRGLATIAFVAIFALALLPTVSRLLAHATGSSAWAEICTPRGLKALSLDEGQKAPATAAAHLDHCPLCGLAGSALAPPPIAVVWQTLAPARAMPRLFGAAPRPLHAWAAGRPRGPPMRA
ncbi:MAG TPA: DUF2946 domain-containing protein [Ideonella sp.]|nr:DUF2946 domain-containing protein [Ideonella sp.]